MILLNLVLGLIVGLCTYITYGITSGQWLWQVLLVSTAAGILGGIAYDLITHCLVKVFNKDDTFRG